MPKKVFSFLRSLKPPYSGKNVVNLLSILLILAVIPVTTYAILNARDPGGKAATIPTLSLVPSTSNVNQGNTLTVEIWEESQAQPVNAVQANFTYDATKFDFLSIDNTGSAFGIEAESTGGNGNVTIARGVASVNGNPPVPVTGLKLVTKVNFQAKQSPGVSAMNFAAGSAIIRSSDNTNILESTSGANYTVINLAPTVNLTSPTNNAFVKGTVNSTATASDDVSINRVEFLVDNVVVSTDSTSPYAFSWNTTTATNGSHTFAARAVDSQNSSTTSNVTVTVDNTAPTVSITAPTNGAVIRGTQNVTASASDAIGLSMVEFLIDGAVAGSDNSSPYSFSLNTSSVTNGSHTLVARATDLAGNVTSSSSISVTVDNSLPTVSVTAPANNTVVKGTITFSATASDNNNVNRVEFLDGSTVLNSDSTSPYSFSLDTTTLTNGAHNLGARAVDTAGNQATASISVIVDNQAPSVPTGLTAVSISGSQINLNWNASTDNVAVAGYEIYRNNVLITTVTTTSYNDTSLVNQTSYNYFIKAKDTAGNLSANSSTVSATTRNSADINGDGGINIFDLSILLTRWGTNDAAADINKNGTVDIFDLSILLSRWGT